ncbi:ricin-type beta-trefoil lectin domain protein [Streptomyces sp. NPDC090445]|uniref:ricin-type beta-trefoil lectin domain protein n=1 Tax=Streptomyces sp. NPDC090445 TaxID=3365963 RepID=UPI0038225167
MIALLLAALPGATTATADDTPVQEAAAPWEKKLFDMTFLTAHNAMANHRSVFAAAFNHAYQRETITGQLNQGARALMLDAYRQPSSSGKYDAFLCHGQCPRTVTKEGEIYSTASQTLTSGLAEVVKFLNDNRQEIVVVNLEDRLGDEHSNLVYEAVSDSGARRLLFNPTPKTLDGTPGFAVKDKDWPTVSDMISVNQRLLFFSSNGWRADKDPRIMYTKEWTVENSFEEDATGSCDGQGGDAKPLNAAHRSLYHEKYTRLFTMNHFSHGTPRTEAAAKRYNTADTISSHVATCMRATGGKKPNFLAVDYFDANDFAARERVQTYNTVRGLTAIANYHDQTVLDTEGGSFEDGTRVVTWTNERKANQQWYAEQWGSDILFFIGKERRLLTNSGGKATLWWDYHHRPDQRWKMVRKGAYYQIVSKQDGKCLTKAGHGQQMVIKSCSSTDVNQLWEFHR